MRLTLAILFGLLFGPALHAGAQQPEPVYIVNGEIRTEIHSIPPANIECVEMLPADEETVAKYGPQANNGVMVITLRYDVAARFDVGGMDFDGWVAAHTEWGEKEPPARFITRFTVNADGTITLGTELESTDKRFRRRVLKALEGAPRWQPATRQGTPVATEHVLRVHLPEGSRIPREPYIILR